MESIQHQSAVLHLETQSWPLPALSTPYQPLSSLFFLLVEAVPPCPRQGLGTRGSFRSLPAGTILCPQLETLMTAQPCHRGPVSKAWAMKVSWEGAVARPIEMSGEAGLAPLPQHSLQWKQI